MLVRFPLGHPDVPIVEQKFIILNVSVRPRLLGLWFKRVQWLEYGLKEQWFDE